MAGRGTAGRILAIGAALLLAAAACDRDRPAIRCDHQAAPARPAGLVIAGFGLLAIARGLGLL